MIITYLVIAIVSFVFFVKWRHSYWKRLGVPEIEDKIFLFGNSLKEMKENSLGEVSLQTYKKFKSMNVKHGGFYRFLVPVWMPVDVDLVKRIFLTDFSHFTGHGFYHHEKDIMTMHLFNLDGPRWKTLRAKLTPTFTSGKMKMMFETLVEKTHGLEKLVGKCAEGNKPIDIKEIFARFTTDIIGSCAFGIECNSMEEPDNEFRKHGKEVIEANVFKIFLVMLVNWNLLAYLGYKDNGRKVLEFFSKIVKDTIKHREENKVYRKDFMHLLLQLKNEGKVSDDVSVKTSKGEQFLTVDEIVAQCFIFFLAGFETSSTTTTFVLFELSRNPDIQDRLRQEINEVLEKHEGKITYDSVMEMKYLDMVINETLRKFPPLPIIPRQCTKDYVIPGSNITIKKGTVIDIPAWGLHMDPEYYPNPEMFNPENFNDENKSSRPECAFLPFGEGPRQCIGLRFGLLQTKVGLVSLIRNFKFSLNSKTQQPIRMESGTFINVVRGNVWLNITKV